MEKEMITAETRSPQSFYQNREARNDREENLIKPLRFLRS